MNSCHADTRCGLTLQNGEGAVLQLHDDSIKHWQHGGDVQEDQDDWLRTQHGDITVRQLELWCSMCITQVQTKHFIVSDIKQTKNPKTFD